MSIAVQRTPGDAQSDSGDRASKGLTSLIRRHAVASYYALAFAISWGGIVLLAGPGSFFSTGATIPLQAAIALVAGPAVACLLLTGLVDGRAGFRLLMSRLTRWRVGARWYAVALLTGPLVIGATMFGLSLVSSEFRPGIVTSNNKLSIVLIGIVLGLVSPFFEELGWTGFALPRLRARYSVLRTGLTMGLLWGAWHFPMFAGNTDPSGTLPSAVIVAALLFSWLVPYRVLMVWVYDRTGSVLMAFLMHAPVTAITFILAPAAATSGTTLVVPVLVFGTIFWVLVAIVALANGGHLTLDQQPAVRQNMPA